MALRADQDKAALIERLAEQARQRMGRDKAGAAGRFLRQFYANVPPADMAAASPERLYGAALGFWQFAAARPAGMPLIRVFTPQIERDSWQSSHSVIEVVTEDMPFLVVSLTEALHRQGLAVHLVIHPVLRLRRDPEGRLTDLYDPDGAPAEAASESFIHFTIDRLTSPERLSALEERLGEVLAAVRAAVADWPAMRDRAAEIAADLRALARPDDDGEIAEAADFLGWLGDDHFTFLGYRVYRFCESGDGCQTLSVRPESGLGILRDPGFSVFDGLRNLVALPPEVRQFLRQPAVARVTKTNRRSRVHRAVHMDGILIKEFGDDGRVIGERLFCGLFTSTAYARMVRDVPLLRRTVSRVLARAGFTPHGHDGRRLTHILGTLPRDELFQMSEDELYDISMGVLHLQERQRTALFVRPDPFERFVSCLVFLPRDRYDTALRKAVTTELERAFEGTLSAYYIQVGDGPLARLHVIVRTSPGKLPAWDAAVIEAKLIEAARGWPERLRDALVDARGEEAGLALFGRYAEAFPVSYREATPAEVAVFDIARLEEVASGGGIAINLVRPLEAGPEQADFKLYHRGAPVPLSEMLPLLETLDLTVVTEQPYEVRPAGLGDAIWIHEFKTAGRDGRAIDIARDRLNFRDCFIRAWSGQAENDGFNRLVLRAGLSWREVALLRAEAKYLRQARIQFSQDYMEATLAAHPAIARLIVELFLARLDPARGDDWQERSDRLLDAIVAAMEGVRSLDEDRILRRFVNLTLAVLRTNYFQTGADGEPKSWLALKLDSQAIDELPAPRPLVEIFVYSPRVEAVHLRGGAVARGGIRWSDRREDFRTEVLGLMKAQMVKNAVIVPVGSKGGFVLKKPPPAGAGRETLQAEGVECYRIFIRGLLDLTDNLTAEGGVAPPPGVVRLDGDDPYLVVAADKGTASFSDLANAVARDYGFWLDDAFASGGSAGYDHKKMAITARGAWESVKRHFRELGRDIQTEDFSCVGVGDMAGDVFGNAMLLSRHIRLLGAFNHQHIFCDPDPDPATSHAERARLAALPRSAWSDYDPAALSAGGRIFERSAKSLELTPEIRARFGLTAGHITPAELIRALLTAEIDLLWFGGIGTFVKAHSESHADAGDKASDAVRVDARQLRAKVIGEGANLAMTQPARVEAAALAGIRLNTDAIDNSGGVDCSDHEVNIKILLGDVVGRGDMTLKQRDRLLAEMTDEVARLVLADNYLQSAALSAAEAGGPERLDRHAHFMRELERTGRLDRAVERLPDDEELAARARDRRGLTRPELAVLLAYAKIALYDDLLASDLPEDPGMAEELFRYFPEALGRRFPEAIGRHRLRREIVATMVANGMVNRMGPIFVRETAEKTGAGAGEIARAYAVVRDVFELDELWRAIEALDGRVAATVQLAMNAGIQSLVGRGVVWLLGIAGQGREIDDCPANIRILAAGVAGALGETERAALTERAEALTAEGVPAALAGRIALLPVLAASVDTVRIASAGGFAVAPVVAVYLRLGERFGLDWLRGQAAKIKSDDRWQRQAVEAVVEDLYAHQSLITERALADGAIEAWSARHRAGTERFDRLLAELKTAPGLDLSRLAVANRQLRALSTG